VQNVHSRARFAIAAGLVLSAATSFAQSRAPMLPATRGSPVMIHKAAGTFEVSLKPQDTPDSGPGATLGRMTIEKTYHGDLVAQAKGEMLTAMAPTKGSGTYVAVEKVTGTLNGRKGSFAMHHSGTMNRGAQELSIVIVPDSGTEELAGIAGRLLLKIADGKHFYEIEYTLAQ
jgi:Protein of unknown function (DUF3224)